MTPSRIASVISLVALLALSAACAPRAGVLRGTPAPARRLPAAELTGQHRRVHFRWMYTEGEFGARGEGVARVAPPDSARMDFFLDGGLGGGAAILTGDSLSAPGGNSVRRLLPSVPMLWAALGRLAAPPQADTAVRVDGDTIRADIGLDPVWRATFAGPRLVRLERLEHGRVAERVERGTDERVRYEQTSAHRTLLLSISRSEEVQSFDPAIWRR